MTGFLLSSQLTHLLRHSHHGTRWLPRPRSSDRWKFVPSYQPLPASPTPHSLAATFPQSVCKNLTFFFFFIPHVSETTQYLSASGRLISLTPGLPGSLRLDPWLLPLGRSGRGPRHLQCSLPSKELQRWALLRTRRVLSQERALCRHGHSGPSSVALQKHSTFFFSQWHFDTALYFMHFLTSALLSILTNNKRKEKDRQEKVGWLLTQLSWGHVTGVSTQMQSDSHLGRCRF